MKKTFNDVKRMLEEKELLFDATQVGEAYDIQGIAARELESEPYNKLFILRPGETYSDAELEGRVSFLAPLCTLDPKVQKLLVERELGGAYPFQLFTVQEFNLDAAEKVIREFLSDEPKVRKEDAPKASMTVADIEAVPENKWVDTHTYGGRCPYCGKELERKDWFGPDYYHPCSCEVGQAAHKHNQHADEIERKRLDDRQKMFDAIKTIDDIKAIPKEIWIPTLVYGKGTCPFCGKHLPSKIVGFKHDKCTQYESCYCELSRAAAEHNKTANPLA